MEPGEMARRAREAAGSIRNFGRRVTENPVSALLTALAAVTDWLFAVAGGHDAAATVAEGALLTGLALAGLARADLAASVLTPRGRVTVLAALFAAAGAVDLGLQSHYGEVMSAIMFGITLACSVEYGRSPQRPIAYGCLLCWLTPYA